MYSALCIVHYVLVKIIPKFGFENELVSFSMMYKNLKALLDAKNCKPEDGMALIEVVNLFAGKWRWIILAPLFLKDMRYTEIQQLIPDITPRMLSRELKDLEMSGIVKRTVDNHSPGLIQYGITNSAKELEPIVIQLLEWAKRHRRKGIVKGKVVPPSPANGGNKCAPPPSIVRLSKAS